MSDINELPNAKKPRMMNESEDDRKEKIKIKLSETVGRILSTQATAQQFLLLESVLKDYCVASAQYHVDDPRGLLDLLKNTLEVTNDGIEVLKEVNTALQVVKQLMEDATFGGALVDEMIPRLDDIIKQMQTARTRIGGEADEIYDPKTHPEKIMALLRKYQLIN